MQINRFQSMHSGQQESTAVAIKIAIAKFDQNQDTR